MQTTHGTDNQKSTTFNKTSINGDHNHTVELGAHDHAVTGQTENLGSGQSLGVKNAYVVLAAWYRVS